MAMTRKNYFSPSRWEQVLMVVIFVLILEVTNLISPVQNMVYSRFMGPMKSWWVKQATNIVSISGDIKKVFNSVAHIQDLELRLAESSAALTELETLKKENKELRFILENTDRPEGRTFLTRPVVSLAKPAVAGGLDISLEKGALVLSRETLLGQLTNIGQHESQVILLFEKEAPAIFAETESGVQGIIRGDGKKIIFTEVARTDELVVGEKIFTLGQPQVEQGVLIGRVLVIDQDMTASVQTAVVEQYISFFESSIVEVR